MIFVEIIMLVAGVWAIVQGELPGWLFGGPKYRLEGHGVRLLGAILVLPLPVAFVGGIVLAFLFGERGQGYAATLEFFAVAAAVIAAIVVSRIIRKPIGAASGVGETGQAEGEIEALIHKKAQGSLIYALLGGTGVGAIVFCPLAYLRAGQALRLIDEHKVGERYRNTAKAARSSAAIIFLFWAVLGAYVIAAIIRGV